jgi:hypothetical protein
LSEILDVVPAPLGGVLARQFLLQPFAFLFDDFEFFLAGVLRPLMLALQQLYHVAISVVELILDGLGGHLLQLLLHLLHVVLSYLALGCRQILLLHLQNLAGCHVNFLLLSLVIYLLHALLYVELPE